MRRPPTLIGAVLLLTLAARTGAQHIDEFVLPDLQLEELHSESSAPPGNVEWSDREHRFDSDALAAKDAIRVHPPVGDPAIHSLWQAWSNRHIDRLAEHRRFLLHHPVTDEAIARARREYARMLSAQSRVQAMWEALEDRRYDVCEEQKTRLRSRGGIAPGPCPDYAAAVRAVPAPRAMRDILTTTYVSGLAHEPPDVATLLEITLLVQRGSRWIEASPAALIGEPFRVELRYDAEPDFRQREVVISIPDRLRRSVSAVKSAADPRRFLSDEQVVTTRDMGLEH